MAVLRVKESFSFNHQGMPVVLRTGQLVEDGHPYVKGHESLFELAETSNTAITRATAQAEETATAAPGERRSMARTVTGKRPEAEVSANA